jgi:hypothetical protein
VKIWPPPAGSLNLPNHELVSVVVSRQLLYGLAGPAENQFDDLSFMIHTRQTPDVGRWLTFPDQVARVIVLMHRLSPRIRLDALTLSAVYSVLVAICAQP